MSAHFTYEWYTTFLQHCGRHGELCRFCDVEQEPVPRIVLRHDIDFDLAAAHALSVVEERTGVRSTYFVLLTSEYYNPASAAGRESLRDLTARGFEVGLHFDPLVYPGANEIALSHHFRDELQFLEAITGQSVRSASVHMPTHHGQFLRFPGVVNAYDPRWFGPDRYLSDSLRTWRHDPYDFIRHARLPRIQVLTHPIHFSETGHSYTDALQRLSTAWQNRAHEYLRRFNRTYRQECDARRETHP